jgi:hypothetical protein
VRRQALAYVLFRGSRAGEDQRSLLRAQFDWQKESLLPVLACVSCNTLFF